MQKKKKAILFLTSHFPLPSISGGRLREYEILKRMCIDYDIYLIVITKTYDMDIRNLFYLKHLCKEIKIFKSFEASDSMFFSKNFPNKVTRIISSEAQKYFDNLVINNIIDLIHIESFYLVYYILKGIHLPTVLVAQNIEYNLLLQEIKLKTQKNIAKLHFDYRQTKLYEIFSWSICDKCIALTHNDYQIITKHIDANKASLIQNGFDHIYQNHLCIQKTYSKNSLKEDSILITGNFLYKPNQDAVIYFCNQIFPKILAKVPTAILYIVGNEPTEEIYAFASDFIHVAANVPNLHFYIQNTSIFVCPLRIGGGIKVKMLEALYCNAVIVTSPIGAQGLDNLFPRPFLIADNASKFAEKIIFLLLNVNARKQLKTLTKSALTHLNTWQESVAQLKSIYDKLVSTTYENKNF